MITKIFVLVGTFVTITACGSSGGSDNSKPVSVQNITGNWEVASLTFKGQTIPYSQTKSENQAGYPTGSGKMQYEISETKYRVISSDDTLVEYALESDYQLVDGKITTPNLKGNHVYGFKIVQLTDNTMTVSPESSEPPDILYNLVRINAGDLATNKLAKIPQSLSYGFTSAKWNLKELVQDATSVENKASTGNDINCSVFTRKNQPTELLLGFYSFMPNKDGGITIGGDQPGMTLSLPLAFDYKKTSETLTVFTNSFRARYKKDAVQLDLEPQGNCAFTVQRNKRMVQVNAECAGVTASPGDGSSTETGKLTFSQSCVLHF